MLILRSRSAGGRPLKPNHFPLHQDRDGNFGFLIGYDRDGDKLLVPISLAEQVADALGSGAYGFRKKIKQVKPYYPLRERLARWLVGKKKVGELKEEMEEGI